MTGEQLLEREAELEAIGHAIALAGEGAGSLVLIEGPAGAGKTALLHAARAAATGAGLLVLSARGAELEREFDFGIVRQLFDEVAHGDGRDASELFARADDPFATRHALYRLTAALGSEQPLAILVDDAQCSDSESIGVMAYIANRLEEIPVVFVVAARSEEPVAAHGALQREAARHGTLLRPAPLSCDATAVMVRTYAPGADDLLCRECYDASGGNPFLLYELATSGLAQRRDVGKAARAADYCPERVTREIDSRLARLPRAAARLAQAAAVLGADASLRQAARLARLDPDEAGGAADALIDAGLLRTIQPLSFRQPLVGAAVYAGLGPAARSDGHARAALLLVEERTAPEAVAAHLVHCQPAGDRWAGEQLIAGARNASARGAADAAATYLRRALAEPPPPECRAELLLELSEAESMVPDPSAAIEHLREALAGDLEVEQRHRATMLLAGLLGHAGRIPDAVASIEGQLTTLAPDSSLHRQAQAALTNLARLDPATRPRVSGVVAQLRSGVEEGDEPDPAALGTIAAELAMVGAPADQTASVAERALAGFGGAATSAVGWPRWQAVRSLVVAESYDAAGRALDRALETASERGAVIDGGVARIVRAELHLRTGDLAAAESDARAVQQLSSAFDWPLGTAWATICLCEVLVARGELDAAADLFADGPFAGPARSLRQIHPIAWLLVARGRLRLAQGRTADAVDDLREAGQRAAEIGHLNPACADWRVPFVDALLDAGQDVEAGRVARDGLKRARAFGAPRAVAVALCTMARIETGYDSVALLREAVELLDASPADLDRARAHAALGAALREVGGVEDARGALRIAVEVAHRCGAQALEEHALTELRATGARPRRKVTTGAGALTPSERRIAGLASAGRQNREIAQELVVTTHTVEFHLRNAYRKLGIASRRQLSAALAHADEPAMALAA